VSDERSPNGRKVLIAGAGPAGLTAAYEAVRAGDTPIVFEKDRIVGGLSRTDAFRGYRFDMGGHRFYTKIERAEKVWHEVLGDDLIRVRRLSRIYYNKTFFYYPLRIGNVLKGLGLWNSFMIGMSFLYAVLFPYKDEDNFERWVINRFGRRLYLTFFKSYTEKVWGIPCDQISAEWAAQRIKGLSLRTAVLHALIGDRNQKVKSLIDQFLYPRLGPGMLWERMGEMVVERGGEVHMGHPVVGIRRDGNRVVGFVLGGDADDRVVTADQYIGSMPLAEAVQMLDPPPPPQVLEAASHLSQRDFLTVCLIVDMPDLFPDNWIYIHDPTVQMGRLQNYKNWSADMVPDPSKSSLGAEYFTSRGEELWETDDDELIELATRELDQLGLAPADKVEAGVVYRQANAYPVYEHNYRDHLHVVEDFLRQMENFQMVGRSGLHKYNNQDHSMLTSMLAVENIHGAEHDIWAVHSDRAYIEEVREDEEPAGSGG
jgi:protoporphyrinogen oxidase